MEKTTKDAEIQEKSKKVDAQEEQVKEAEAEKKVQAKQKKPVKKKSKTEELGEKLAELQDKYLRLSAEFDNYRKRTLKEKIELQDSAKEDVFRNILPVVDDLERALSTIENVNDLQAVKEGVKLIHSKFSNYLKQQGVREIEALDKELDTDLHDAVTKFPVEEEEKKGKVVDVIEKGYLLKEKVIRYAKVVIGE